MTADNLTNEPTPERWRKKPVEIEARRFSGAMELIDAEGLALWCGGTFKHDTGAGQEYKTYYWSIEIPTLEGTMRATPGDYIIRGVQGEFYPCRGDIFEQTYERAALVAAQGAAPQAESAPKSSYISPSLPGMIRNLWKSDPSENSVRTALKLAGDLIQELIDLKAAQVLPSSGVDEDALAEVIAIARNRWAIYGTEAEPLEKHVARAVIASRAEWLKGQGR